MTELFNNNCKSILIYSEMEYIFLAVSNSYNRAKTDF